MKFDYVNIYNFRNYRYKNSFSFKKEIDDNKNITLIGGLNGAGKTTLLDAIKICLYGKKFTNGFLSKKDYNDYIKSSINKKAIKKKDPKCYVELGISLDDTYPPYTLNIKRSWNLNNLKEIDEQLEITRGDRPLEVIPEESWQEYINHLIPFHVSEFFFFNGEKVKEFAVGKYADDLLKSSIKDLIGLNLYENLHRDLGKLKSKIRRRNDQKGNIQNQINEYDKQIDILENEKEEIKNKILEGKKLIKKNNKKIQDKQRELKRKAGAFAQQKTDMEKKVMKLIEKNAQLNEKITTISKDYIPFFLSKKMMKQLSTQLDQELEIKNFTLTQNVIKNKLEQLQTELNKKSTVMRKLSKNDSKILNQEINSILLNAINKNKNKKIEMLHDLTLSDIEKIKNFLHTPNKNINKNYEKNLKEREQNNIEINGIKNEMKQIPNEKYVMDSFEETNKIKLKNQQIEKSIEEFEKRIQAINEEKESINTKIEKIEEEIICVGEDNKKITYINRILSILNKYMKEMIKLNSKNLENTISRMYYSLSNKEDMVKEIKVDPDSFTTQLYDFDGNLISKKVISEGEKEIYAISVLWGLSTISHHKLPMIIDTPLSKLDNTHVNNIVNNFLPKASDQVILLSQDREIDQNVYSKLKEHIYQSYTIMQTEENKIREGYFFD